MGILNVTPDSFSDGGEFPTTDSAVDHALRMVAEGAGIIDIGGESTRPGSVPVSNAEQIRRVVPVIRQLSRLTKVEISIDTTSSEVAKAALDNGASIINDISALRFDKQMAKLASSREVPVILMHMQAEPRTMQVNPIYSDVFAEVKCFLTERIDFAVAAGIDPSRIIIDPGIGFGKTLEHNLQILSRISEFKDLQTTILVGPSRKSFIGKVLDIDNPMERQFGTAAVVAWCTGSNVDILRVHDVKNMMQVARMAKAICAAKM